MPPPLPRYSGRAYSSLISPSRFSLPRFHYRVGLHIILFEVCSAFTHVAACTLAQSPYFVTAIRGLQTFRHLHACPGCFRLERSPGGPCTHWKSAALSRRTWKTDIVSRATGEPSDASRLSLSPSKASGCCARSPASKSLFYLHEGAGTPKREIHEEGNAHSVDKAASVRCAFRRQCSPS